MDRAAAGRVICPSAALVDGGRGVRFAVNYAGETQPAFVVRYRGTAHAYLNRCAHRSVELDWEPGEFFSRFADALICSTHGALYHAESGACLHGPCNGGGLVKLAVIEKNSNVYLAETENVRLVYESTRSDSGDGVSGV